MILITIIDLATNLMIIVCQLKRMIGTY